MYDGIMAETVTILGLDEYEVEAYMARPLGAGPYGSVVVVHHLPGYDEATKEIVRTFAVNGYVAVCPNLYSRQSPGATPDDAAAAARASGGVPDEKVVGDIAGSASYLRRLTYTSGKVGVIGYCSGGRQAFLAACRPDVVQLDAAVDCYGVVVGEWPDGHPLAETPPIIDLAEDLSVPLLGLFGAEDKRPSSADVDEMARVLEEHGKTYEFHSFEGAGHAFFSIDRPAYRPAAAREGWDRVWQWFDRYLR